jgi:hypothetical protein
VWRQVGPKQIPLLRSQQPEHLPPPGRPSTGGLDGVGVDQTGDPRLVGSAVEREGSRLYLHVRLGVVSALEQVAAPRRHEEGLEELAVCGHILVNAPARPAEAPPHDAQLGHGGQEVVDIFPVDAVLDEDQDRPVFGVDVLSDGERWARDELQPVRCRSFMSCSKGRLFSAGSASA